MDQLVPVGLAWFQAPGYWLSRWLFERVLAASYLIAFLVAANQFRPLLGLLRRNPFPDRPPALIRASVYHYRFTIRRERRETGAWWVRERAGTYLPPVGLARVSAALNRESPVPDSPHASRGLGRGGR